MEPPVESSSIPNSMENADEADVEISQQDPIVGSNFVNIPPFSRDIRLLLSKYMELNTTSLKEFKNLWKSLKFSYIHEGRPDEVNYETYIQEVFTSCIGYLIFPQDRARSDDETQLPINFRVRIAIIYLLYYLYCTQPKKRLNEKQQPVQIKISIEAFTELMKILEDFKSKDLYEPYVVLSRLKSLHAFEYCAMVYVDPLMSSLKHARQDVEEEIISEDKAVIANTSHIPSIDLNTLKSISEAYQQTKRQIIESSERSAEDITHYSNSYIGNISVSKTLSIVKPNFVEDIKNASKALKLTNEQKVNQFLDKWENDPQGTALIKKKRRKKRVKKKEDEEKRPKSKPTTKKTPSKVSLEVSKAVNDFISSNICEDVTDAKKKKSSSEKSKKKSKDNGEKETKKRKKSKEDDDQEEKPKKKSKKSKKQEENGDEEKPKKKATKKKEPKKKSKKPKSSESTDSDSEPETKKKRKKTKESDEDFPSPKKKTSKKQSKKAKSEEISATEE